MAQPRRRLRPAAPLRNSRRPEDDPHHRHYHRRRGSVPRRDSQTPANANANNTVQQVRMNVTPRSRTGAEGTGDALVPARSPAAAAAVAKRLWLRGWATPEPDRSRAAPEEELSRAASRSARGGRARRGWGGGDRCFCDEIGRRIGGRLRRGAASLLGRHRTEGRRPGMRR
jgi:hypothetical protein